MLRSRGASSAPTVEGKDIRLKGRRGRRLASAAALVACAVFFSFPHAARAQIGGSGGPHVIYGEFKVDESKAGGMVSISFVLVLMTDTGIVVERQSVMNDTRFRFTGLLNGNYDLVVESAGMPVTRIRIQLFGQSKVELKQDITLEWERESAGGKPEAKKGTISAADAYERTPANRALFKKASAAIEKKKFDEAAAILRKIVEADPKDHLAWTDLGTMHFALGDAAEAERAYARALSARPDYLAAAVNLGRLRLAAKNYEQAVEVLRPAAEKHPLSADAHQLLGEAYQLTGKSEDALKHLGEALRLDPEGKADTHLRLAMIHDATGRKDLAAEELEKFLAKRPASPDRRKFELYVKENKKQ